MYFDFIIRFSCIEADMALLVFGLLLAMTLTALSVIDLKTMILPNILTFPLIGVGLVFSYFHTDLTAAIIGTVVGYVGFVALELVYKNIRGRDGLGRGDAKLLAAGGAWCGWFGLPFIILIASGAGLVQALLMSLRKDPEKHPPELPFGPHLALGIYLTWLALFVLS